MGIATDGFCKRLEVRVDRQQWERLKALAYALDVHISDTVRRAIDDLYDRNERGEL